MLKTSLYLLNQIWTKTSIRYAKENDREKRARMRERERERKKGRRREIEREGDISEIEREILNNDKEL